MFIGQRIIITQGRYKGQVGNLLGAIPTSSSHPVTAHLHITIGNKKFFIPECNTHPACTHHAARSARWSFKCSSGEAFYCQECAKLIEFKAFGQPLAPVLRYEPMSEQQISAALMWQYHQADPDADQERLACLVCCEKFLVGELSVRGACQKCVNMPQPGLLYPFKIEE